MNRNATLVGLVVNKNRNGNEVVGGKLEWELSLIVRMDGNVNEVMGMGGNGNRNIIPAQL